MSCLNFVCEWKTWLPTANLMFSNLTPIVISKKKVIFIYSGLLPINSLEHTMLMKYNELNS